jgi:hypothetical protein
MVSHRLCLHLALNARDLAHRDREEFVGTYRALTEGSPGDEIGALGSGKARTLLTDPRSSLVPSVERFLHQATDLLAAEVLDPSCLGTLADLTSQGLLDGLNRLVEAFQADLDAWSQARRDRIGALIDHIEDLGSRLHVVSINSRVISARAGTVGRAYRVVNDELQALGSSTANAAHQLRQLQEENSR